MPRCFNITNQQQTAMKHIVLRCGCVVLSFIAIVLFGLLQRIQAAENILPDHRVHAAPSKIQPKLAPMLAVQTAELDRGPLFIENRGQFNENVKFQVRTGGKTLWVTNDGIVFDVMRPKQTGTRESGLGASSPLPLKDPRLLAPAPPIFNPKSKIENPKPADLERLAFSQEFIGANPKPAVEASACQPGIYNYFIGKDPKNWITHVAAYSEVVYRDIWPGIDLRLYANGPNIEQEFVVKPQADLTKVQVEYKGIDALRVADDGSLLVNSAFGELRESKPRIYQQVAGKERLVEGRFKLLSDTAYTFEVMSYQTQYALVIDPTLLYSTFLGGSAGILAGNIMEQANGIAVDSSGNAYVTGFTQSLDFPTTTGAIQPTVSYTNGSAFVTKLNPLGSHLVYSTYLVGQSLRGFSSAQAVAVDSAGEAYVVGWAGDQGASPGFPTTPNAFQSACTGSHFLTKLNATGDALVYSSCFGSDSFAFEYGGRPIGIALDSAGHAYMAGTTTCGIPTTSGGYQPICPGGNLNAFMFELDPSASGAASVLYGTYLTGSRPATSESLAYGVAVDSFGNAYVTGNTNESDFPVTAGAFQTTLKGSANGFISKLNPTVSGPGSLVYSTYLGGSGGDEANAIAVDSSGNAYVTGGTYSNDFPVTNGAFQTTNLGSTTGSDFITKINAAGNNLIYSTYLGTNALLSSATGIALDVSGDVYVTGSTSGQSFPVTSDAFQHTLPNTNGSAFLTKFNATGSALLYSSYLGGSLGYPGDFATSVAVDQAGDAYVAGATAAFDFPVTSGAFRVVMDGNADAFVAKFALGAIQGLSIAGMTPNVGGNAGTVTTTIVGSGFQQGATAQLSCPSQPNIVGTNTAVSSYGRTITATFNLVGTTAEGCNVVVTNPDNTTTMESNGFTVQQGGAPEIAVSLIGRNVMRGGQAQLYFLNVANHGNIDGKSLRVWLGFPNYIQWQAPRQPPASSGQLKGVSYVAFDLSAVATHSSTEIPVLLAVPDNPIYAHQSFELQVWNGGQ